MQRGGGPIELLADPRALAFYLAFGFTAVEALVTMRGEGHGRRTLAPAAAWSAVHGARSICAWTPEAWAASDGRASITDARDLVRALVSREGTALLVQRWCTDAPQVHDAARELADAVPAGVSWLVPWLADVSPVTAQLYAAGLQPVQRAVRLHLARKHDASSDRA
jgi:hypothetical protein